jgi:hypothetical protein
LEFLDDDFPEGPMNRFEVVRNQWLAKEQDKVVKNEGEVEEEDQKNGNEQTDEIAL